MKILTFLISMVSAVSMSFAQSAPINFETNGKGADWTWAVFENATNPPLEIVNNPSATGINTSSKVAKFTALKTGNPWAGCESSHGTKDLGPFILDSTNSIIKIMVLKTTISPVGIKLASPTGWAQVEIKVSNTKINEWEELTFDFSGYTNPPASEGKLDQIIVFPDFTAGARSQDNVIYFDNITFNSKGVAPIQPTTAAPTPTRNAADVISLFSNAYSNVSVDTWRTSWSEAVLTDLTIAGNATKKYSNLNFVGIETIANQIDISGMTHIHLDVWSADFNSLGVKLVDFGPNGIYQGTPNDDKEHQVDFNALAKGQWVSLDIPVSSFTGLTTKKNIAQFILVGMPSGATTIYIDNVYFYKGNVVIETGPATAAPIPTRNAADVISMFSNTYINVPVDTWRTDWSAATLTDTMVHGNATKRYSKLDFVGIETVTKQLDISAMTHMHIDVWSSDFTFFGVKLVDFGADGIFGGGNDREHQVDFSAPAKGQWVSLDIPLSSFTGLTTNKNIAQLIFVGRPTGSATVYVDNVYFYKGSNMVETAPTTAAPTPTRKASDVISLFSNAYTNVQVDTWRTDWSSATLEDVQIQTNATKKYSKLDFVGIETVAKQVDLSNMTHMHIDVWSPDFTFFGVKLVDFGADGAFGGGNDREHQVDFNTPVKGQWVSLDIPIASFTGLTTKKNIAQLIFVGRPTGTTTVFVDNVYFYNKPSSTNNLLADKVKIFPNPVKSGDILKYEGEIEKFEIFDIRGVKVLSSTETNSSEIQMDKGLFLIKIKTVAGEIITKKLVVQ